MYRPTGNDGRGAAEPQRQRAAEQAKGLTPNPNPMDKWIR